MCGNNSRVCLKHTMSLAKLETHEYTQCHVHSFSQPMAMSKTKSTSTHDGFTVTHTCYGRATVVS